MTEKDGTRRLWFLAALVLLFAAAASGPALDFSIRPGGFVYIPAGDKAEYFTPGGGGNLGLDLNFSGLISGRGSLLRGLSGLGFSVGAEGGYAYAPLGQNAGGGLHLYSAGGALGLHYFLLSRIFLRADAALGWYQGVSPNVTSGDLWFRAGGNLGFRFNPSFIVSANGGYGGYKNHYGGTLYSGIYAGLAAQFSFETGRAVSGIEIEFVQDGAVYPLFLSLYQNAPAGTLTIINHENAEIRNVEVSFRAGDYTSSEFICGAVPFIARGRREALPLYADFSPEIINFTENGRIAGEVVIRYSFLGARRETVQSAVLQIARRGSFPDGDARALAAFVSPTAPELLEYSKYVTGMARLKNRTGLNRNMQFAVWLFEGLLAAGLRREEGVSPNPAALSGSVQDIQYPAQTLAYRSGSAADIALAYSAALEASGISSALVPLADDFITAFSLGITEEQAQSLFNDMKNLLIFDNEAWLPLSMTAFDEGFAKSWKAASDRLGRIVAEEDVDFITLRDAWAVYPPVPFPALGVRIVMPDSKNTGANADKALDAYIAGEIQPLIASLNSQIRGGAMRGPNLAALYNQLGNLYIRSGNVTGAKAAYEEAAEMGSAPAMINRGSAALLENDYAAARRWFTQALRLQPDNMTARRGLEQVSVREKE
jgi:tetratricopeptide (TPR) repeat protein